jgi:tRNA nucleotidyltransferase (CCA-adding enzyme)
LTLAAPSAVREITQRLEQAGFSSWAVGGAVRDALLGGDAPGPHLPGDWDLTTLARPDQVRKLFRRTVPIGIEHGTVGVLANDGVLYEVTTFRRDVETTGRHAVVEFADSLEEDLARRDFTLNAIAWHPLTEELRDPYGGFDDLRGRILRTVGEPAERFAEDYLRVLRALRFAGHFGLHIDRATWEALRSATPQLTRLSAERVREELWKIFSKTPRASVALRLYAESGSLDVLLPELTRLRGLFPEEGHPLDAWAETLAALDALPSSRPLLRATALLHKVGMPLARQRDLRGGWRFTGHEGMGARIAGEIMRRLKASNADTERVVALVARQSLLPPPDAPDAGLRRWLLHVPPALVRDLYRLRFALWRARPVPNGDRDLVARWQRIHAVLQTHPVLETTDLAINGSDLKRIGLEPGPRFGEILRALLDRVIERPELNTPEQLLALVKEILAS